MKRCTLGASVILAVLLPVLSLQSGPSLELTLRVYEGSRDVPLSPPAFVTSYYMQPTITANLPTEPDQKKETAQIKRVFNLESLTLLTEAALTLGEERAGQPSDTVHHFFRLNGNAFQVNVTLLEKKPSMRFRVVFNEIMGEKPMNILTTEMLLVGGHTAILGFEDRSGKPYFCSFYVSGPPDTALPPPPPLSLTDEIKEKIEQFEKGAIKASEAIKPPRLLKKVDPVYPEEAKRQKREGMVILNARADTQGNISDVMILKSTNEVFNAAALEAVKQWKYEPCIVDGKPRDIVFTVTIQFVLK